MRSLACAILSAFVLLSFQAPAAVGQSSFFGWWPYSPKEKEKFVQTPSLLDNKPATATSTGAPQPARGSTATTGVPGELRTGGTTIADKPSTTATGTNRTTTSSPVAADDQTPFFQSPFADWTWPEFHMPQVSLPKPQWPSLPGSKEFDETRNTWVDKQPEPEQPSPWQTVTDGASRVGTSTKAAWRKTVDVFTPEKSSEPPSRVAQRDAQPSIWNRMFSSGSEPPPKGPQTVSEWMGQERLKP